MNKALLIDAEESAKELRGWANTSQSTPIFDCLVDAANIIDELIKANKDLKKTNKDLADLHFWVDSTPGENGIEIAKHLPPVTAQWILEEASATIKTRGQKRDQGSERSMQRIVRVFHALTDHHMTETEGWMFMVVLKLCREKTGQDLDNWVDGAAYMALAAESVEKTQRR